jgi:hypothetical protein
VLARQKEAVVLARAPPRKVVLELARARARKANRQPKYVFAILFGCFLHYLFTGQKV